MPIFSRQNPLVKQYRLVRSGLDRTHLFLEGVRLVEDAVQSGSHVESVLIARDLLTQPRLKKLVDRLTQQRIRCEVTSWAILEYLSDVESPQGILAIAPRPVWDLMEVLNGLTESPVVIVVEGWRDPGNFGAMLRSAEALGIHVVISTPQTVDPFSPKVIRASMGSALRLPIVDQFRLPAVSPFLADRGIQLVAASSGAQLSLTSVDFTLPTAIVVGNEATGLSKEAESLPMTWVRIPMKASVESLNAAMAAAILVYEVARQRGFKELT